MTCFEKTEESLRYIGTTLSASLEVVPALALSPFLGVLGLDLSTSLDVNLVTAHNYLDPAHINTSTLAHLIFPMDQRVKAVSVVKIKDHQNPASIRIKFGPNKLIVLISRHIEEVNCHSLAFDLELFYSVVDADSLNVAINELFLAIALDEAAFSYFGIPNTDDLECDLLCWGLTRVIRAWGLRLSS
jgi:hypothetical protein